MKNYIILLLIGLSILTSCSIADEPTDLTPDAQKELLTKHQWKGLDMTVYVNDQERNKNSIKHMSYTFKNNNYFILKENGQTLFEGTWHLLNVADMPVLKLSYQTTDQNHINEYYEISILTDDYLQITSSQGNIQKQYFFTK